MRLAVTETDDCPGSAYAKRDGACGLIARSANCRGGNPRFVELEFGTLEVLNLALAHVGQRKRLRYNVSPRV